MEERLGVFYGVSVGPGDPELLTVKACRVLKACPVIAAPQSQSGEQLALSIAGQAVDLDGKALLSLPFTMLRDRRFWKPLGRKTRTWWRPTWTGEQTWPWSCWGMCPPTLRIAM